MALLGVLGIANDWEFDGRLRCCIIEDKSEAKGVVGVAEREGSSDCDVVVPMLTVPTLCAVEQSRRGCIAPTESTVMQFCPVFVVLLLGVLD